jgi:hypothetical protein
MAGDEVASAALAEFSQERQRLVENSSASLKAGVHASHFYT